MLRPIPKHIGIQHGWRGNGRRSEADQRAIPPGMAAYRFQRTCWPGRPKSVEVRTISVRYVNFALLSDDILAKTDPAARVHDSINSRNYAISDRGFLRLPADLAQGIEPLGSHEALMNLGSRKSPTRGYAVLRISSLKKPATLRRGDQRRQSGSNSWGSINFPHAGAERVLEDSRSRLRQPGRAREIIADAECLFDDDRRCGG